MPTSGDQTGAIRESLIHIRQIVFATVVSCATLIYVGLSVDRLPRAISDEVADLVSLVSGRTQLAKDEQLFAAVPSLEQHLVDQFQNAAPPSPLRWTTSGSTVAGLSHLLVDASTCDPSRFTESPLQSLRAELAKCEWRLVGTLRIDFSSDDAEAIRTTLERYRGLSPVLHRSYYLAAARFEIESRDRGRLTGSIRSYRPHKGQGVTLTDPDSMALRRIEEDPLRRLKDERVAAWTLGFRLAGSEEQFRTDGEWFAERFPILQQEWSSLREQTPPRLIALGNPTSLSFRAPRKVQLFGLRIPANVVGVVGPLLILISLAYLYVYLEALLTVPELPRVYISPWVGAMRGDLPYVLSALSLLATPTAAVGTATFCLLAVPIPVVLLAMFAIAALGWKCLATAKELARVLNRSPESDLTDSVPPS